MAILNRKPDYSDLDLDFIAHPTTGDVMKKVGEDAIKRSIRNLVLTNYYDRPFNPGIGSNVNKLLFDQPSPILENIMKDSIRTVIESFEPRVNIRHISVNLDNDNNGFNVSLLFSVNNSLQPVSSEFFLERIR
jgi:phage baseplate assembly protein W